MLAGIFCVLAVACKALATEPANDLQYGTLAVDLPDNISTLRACLPYNLKVESGNDTTGNVLLLQAPGDVVNATTVSVQDGALVLSINGSFATNSSIISILQTANSSVLRAVQNFGVGDIVFQGIDVQEFSASATGIGSVYGYNLTSPNTRVVTSGTSTILLNGSIGSVDVESSGTSRVFLVNATGIVGVQLSGISTLYVDGRAGLDSQNSGTRIVGTADNLSTVLYMREVCNVQRSTLLFSRAAGLFGNSIFGNPCRQVEPLDLSFQHTFTCGLQSNGTSQCAGPMGGEASAQDIPLNSSIRTSSDSSGERGVGVTRLANGLNTTTLQRPGGRVTTGTYTSGPGASASAGSRVAGSGFPPFGLFQQESGGAPAQVDAAQEPAQEPEGARLATEDNASSQLRLSIPAGDSSLTVVGLECADAELRAML